MRNYELFLERLSSFLKYSLVCFTVLVTVSSLLAKENFPEHTNTNADIDKKCIPYLKSFSNCSILLNVLPAAGMDSNDVTKEEGQQSTAFYGVEFQLYGKWEKVSDRDFPQGALLLNDGGAPDGSAFVSVIPENMLEGGPVNLAKMSPTGKRTIDGKQLTVYEADHSEEDVHLLFLVFDDLKHKGSNLVIISFTPKKLWNSVSVSINEILDNAKIK
jgi:hypothetical protein